MLARTNTCKAGPDQPADRRPAAADPGTAGRGATNSAADAADAANANAANAANATDDAADTADATTQGSRLERCTASDCGSVINKLCV